MPESQRTSAARDLFTQADALGVPPLMLGGSPWAVRPDLLATLADAARLPIMAGFTTKAAKPAAENATGGVAVIPLTGIITPQGSYMSFLFGGAPGGLEAFTEAFEAAINSPDISAVVIDVDSPGGLCDLVPETAETIREARGSGKRIVALADTQMCSAAYWIASQADEVVCTPSGYAGSIGVYRVHEDWSRANADAGLAVTYVSAGKYKTEGNPNEPLGPDGQAQWQADVQDMYDQFVADVAAGRGVSAETVIADYGEGRALNAKRALEAGLVDRIASYDDVIADLLGLPAAPGESPSARLASAVAKAQADLLAQQVAAQEAAAAGTAALETVREPDADVMSDEERAYRAALNTAA